MSREMKESGVEWLGVVPEDWNILKFKNVVTNMVNGKWGEDKKGDSNDISVVRIADFDRSNGKIKNVEFTVRNIKDIYNSEEHIINPNQDLLIEKSGGGDKTPVGQVVHYEISKPATFTNFISKLTINTMIVNLSYLNYYFSVIYNNNISWKHIKQTTGLQNLDVKSYLSELISIPKLEIQNKIAELLKEKTTEIDNILEKTRQSIEELKAYKQSLITETVTKGLNPDAPMKDSGIEWIDKIPENWRIGKLKYFSSVNDESLSNKTSLDYKFKYIDIGSVSLEKGIVNYEKTNFKDAPSRARRIVKDNDIIISTVRTYLKAIAVIRDSKDMIVSTGFAVIRPKRIKSNFLSYYLKSDIFTERVSQLSEGIAYPSIASEKLINIKIIVPDEKSQLEIGEFLDIRTQQIDTLINKKQQMLKELESYKQSLIYEYVTGKKEVE